MSIKFEGMSTVTYLGCEDYTINKTDDIRYPLSIYEDWRGLSNTRGERVLGFSTGQVDTWHLTGEKTLFTRQGVLYHLNLLTIDIVEGFLK